MSESAGGMRSIWADKQHNRLCILSAFTPPYHDALFETLHGAFALLSNVEFTAMPSKAHVLQFYTADLYTG